MKVELDHCDTIISNGFQKFGAVLGSKLDPRLIMSSTFSWLKESNLASVFVMRVRSRQILGEILCALMEDMAITIIRQNPLA
jgi:hypothetical protein